ncbi:hypothetical protein VTL71DRAFT_15449 [Oculimacula yallundae]|uniref:2EXR domain-containing protein n=1 Tax=Oculimacula yallundae TaxID=86028 RepID=A0ABR4CHY0_9HELO
MACTNNDQLVLKSSTPTSWELVESDTLTDMMGMLSPATPSQTFTNDEDPATLSLPVSLYESPIEIQDGSKVRPRASFPPNTITTSPDTLESKDSYEPEHQSVSTSVVIPSRELENQHPFTDLVPSSSASATTMSAHPRSDVRLITSDKFTLFPKLPAELRLQVWKEAYSKPRRIEMCTEDYTANWWAELDLDYSALVAVCHESRSEILKTHLFLGKKKNENQKSTSTYHRRILFDGAKDTIVFRRDKFLAYMDLGTWTKQVSLVVLRNIGSIVWEGHQEYFWLPARNTCLNNLVQCVGDRDAIASMSALKTVHFSHYGGIERLVLLGGVREGDSEEDLEQLKWRIGDAVALLIRRATRGGFVLHPGQCNPQKNDHKVQVKLGRLLDTN